MCRVLCVWPSPWTHISLWPKCSYSLFGTQTCSRPPEVNTLVLCLVVGRPNTDNPKHTQGLLGKGKGNSANVTLSHVRVSMQSIRYVNGHLPHMDIRLRLGATQGTDIPIITHNILIIMVLLCMCSPYMCRFPFLWTIWRVLHLSSNQKLTTKSACLCAACVSVCVTLCVSVAGRSLRNPFFFPKGRP